jgi:formylglycine-generating enzyme required for sulfatase activity
MSQNAGDRLVTITYRLSEPAVITLDVKTNAVPFAATGWVSIGGEHICGAQGAVWRKVTAADAVNGDYTITWQPVESWFDDNGDGFKVGDGRAKAVVTAWPLDNTPDYMVVDLTASGGADTQKYYTSTNFLPGGLLDNQDYRTSRLVMRKIMAKDVTWTMGTDLNTGEDAAHLVTLTNNYYIGVFEVTYSQWKHVMGSAPYQYFNYADDLPMRPLDSITTTGYSNNRYSSARGAYYPDAPTSGSFIGTLNSLTGLDFDLPSEAQWEFAARAGHGHGYWGDGSRYHGESNTANEHNLLRLGRVRGNMTAAMTANNLGDLTPANVPAAEGGTAIVGSYAPNSWGLYDTAGNVSELCLDRYQADITSLNGAVNTNTVNGRVVGRGARLTYVNTSYNLPSYRFAVNHEWGTHYFGIRLVCRAGLK